ncbi:helix-turn-helix domain-containing protein [Burkholderia pseudomultivorans]|uniref:XRE family transcriptional regulator n=1 Tax=Burkholderia pseudomultivorans TaxID=1207504 RepID=A0A132E7Z5_9BURK|nr:helix-turn-helix transcriptional regulator [Burkholderia pseudomultivorans]KWF20382.1 XRE family transcriptional regulator [Burkholderia pseudomultivorans]
MTIDETKMTTFQSICTIILRELRVARGIHQAVLADHCGKPPSFWEKIESGKTKLDFETLLRVCRGLDIVPSVVMQTAERYTWALRDRGWSVVFTDIGSADVLMEQAPKYWTSPGYRFWSSSSSVGPSILDTPRWMDNVPVPGWYGLTAAFVFADSESFRKSQLDEERHRPFVGPMRPFGNL